MEETKLTDSEQERFEIIRSCIDGDITNKDASVRLGLKVRQVQRIKRAVEKEKSDKMVKCQWCQEGKCRSGDEDNCDFKTLPMEKVSIIHRIDDEFAGCNELLKQMKKADKESDAKEYMTVMYDKLTGIKIMREILQSKFGVSYFPKGRIEFTKLVLEANKKMKKLR